MTSILVKWWYSEAIAKIFKYIKAAYVLSADLFSVRICIRTMFDPWKRDMISYEGLTIQQRFQVWSLNMASRFIGAVIKFSTLLGFLLFCLLLSLFSLLVILVWIFYPVIIVYFFYKAFV